LAKILLTGDLHVHPHKHSLYRLQDCLDAFKWVFRTALKEGIKSVIFLGDLFQDRERIQVLPYQRTYEIIKEYVEGESLDLYLLIGNHDMWFADKRDVSSVYPLGSVPGVHIINRCETINIEGLDIDFLPFALNPLKSLEGFAGTRSRVLCGHSALDGAELNTLYKIQADVSVEYDGDMVKMDAKKFTAWERVFLGHYHGEQRIGHIEYVGSPLQINFAEAFQQKHLLTLDPETLETDYIINTFSPRHLILKEEELDYYDLKNTFVKLEPKDISATNLVDLKKNLVEEREVLTVEFASPKGQDDHEIKAKIEDVENMLMKDREEMLEQYLRAQKIPEELDFDKLLEIGKSICEESQIE